MSIRPIRTKADYKAAVAFIERNFDAKPNSRTAEIVEVLVVLVDKYEDEHFPIEAPTPIEAIKFRMEQLGLHNADLAKMIGQRSRVSEILNAKRPLSITMVRRLHRALNIPAECLIGS
jgi:HTH-type transcriptional regulator/antitoxin HigA